MKTDNLDILSRIIVMVDELDKLNNGGLEELEDSLKTMVEFYIWNKAHPPAPEPPPLPSRLVTISATTVRPDFGFDPDEFSSEPLDAGPLAVALRSFGHAAQEYEAICLWLDGLNQDECSALEWMDALSKVGDCRKQMDIAGEAVYNVMPKVWTKIYSRSLQNYLDIALNTPAPLILTLEDKEI